MVHIIWQLREIKFNNQIDQRLNLLQFRYRNQSHCWTLLSWWLLISQRFQESHQESNHQNQWETHQVSSRAPLSLLFGKWVIRYVLTRSIGCLTKCESVFVKPLSFQILLVLLCLLIFNPWQFSSVWYWMSPIEIQKTCMKSKLNLVTRFSSLKPSIWDSLYWKSSIFLKVTPWPMDFTVGSRFTLKSGWSLFIAILSRKTKPNKKVKWAKSRDQTIL